MLVGSGYGHIGNSAISSNVSVTIQAVLMAATLRTIVRQDARIEALSLGRNWRAAFEAIVRQIPAITRKRVASATLGRVQLIWQKAAVVIRPELEERTEFSIAEGGQFQRFKTAARESSAKRMYRITKLHICW
jgi:hypothetical protein